MVKANIVENGLIFVPFDENLPFIEMTEQQYEDVVAGKLQLINGILTNTTPIIEKENRKIEISKRLNQLSQDFIQILCGAVIEDENEKIQEFRTLHNELRQLEGKEPRVYDGGEENAIQ